MRGEIVTGVAAALRVKGKATRVIAQGGDGGTTDIGFGCLSGMFERNEDAPAIGSEGGNPFGTGKSLPLLAMAHRLSTVKQLGDGEMTIEKMRLGDDGVPVSTGELETIVGDTLVLALGQAVDLDALRAVPDVRFTKECPCGAIDKVSEQV